MEGPQRRDINELLTQGFFTTSRGKSPSKYVDLCYSGGIANKSYRPTAPRTNEPSSSFLKTPAYEAPRDRSRSRVRKQRRPPPTVEDEVVSLAREARSKQPSYDPPLRGIIDQVPIILEADVSKAEAARLQAQPLPKEKDDNAERRFVLIPKSDTYAPNEEEEKHRHTNGKTPKVEAPRREEPRREENKETLNKPPIARRRSRQDLPALETKVPRDIPPQFRRSASAFAAIPKDQDETPKAHGTPRTSAGDSFLSPDVSRGKKDYFGSVPAPLLDSIYLLAAQQVTSAKRVLKYSSYHSGEMYRSFQMADLLWEFDLVKPLAKRMANYISNFPFYQMKTC